MKRPHLPVALSLCLGAWLTGPAAPADEPAPAAKPPEVEAASLPLRTALYHDPTLGPPLERLLELYQGAGRARELVEVYRQHVAQYPADTGALIVLLRLLAATNDPETGRMVRAAVTRFPAHPFLQYLLYEQLQRTHDPAALDALDRALTAETLPARRRAWLETLLPLAVAQDRRDLAQRHLERLAAESPTPEGKLEAARKAMAYRFYAPALAVLTAALAQTPGAETGIELELAASSAELGLGQEAAAARRLEAVLGRVAPDYWRRPEILHRRTALVKSDGDREAMLAAARTRLQNSPNEEGPALEVAQLLAAFEFRREALETLLAASRRLPASEKIEKAALDLFDLLRDERGREAFLAQRLQASPERPDLALARVRSLLLLGRREEATALFAILAARLEGPARLEQTLELARFLRRASLPDDAATYFQQAIALAPGRLEIRRELAETWLAAGQKQKVRAVFAAPLPEDLETENLLEVVQFFLRQEMFAEARTALAARVAKEPQNFDLRLMQLTVATRLAEASRGEKLLAETRALADTEARYRRWLEAAFAFHEAMETGERFRAEEQQRLLAAPSWKGEEGSRRVIFAEVAAAHGGREAVVEMLAGALKEGDLAPERRVEILRREVALLENDPAQAAAVEGHLQTLEKEDAARAADYRIRRVLLLARQQRGEDMSALLGPEGEKIDLRQVTEAPLLNGLENLLAQNGGTGGKLRLAVLERLLALDPTNRQAWERWLAQLALSGDEERLRTAGRRLLEGVDRLPLSEETRDLLRVEMLASHWRSLVALLTAEAGAESRLPEALPLLDSAGRLARSREEWLWVAWTRALVLNRLGRREAREEALAELERVAARPAPPAAAPAAEEAEGSPAPPAPAADLIVFPDGLSIALPQARACLTRPASAAPLPLPREGEGPRGTLRAAWVFETDTLSGVLALLPVGADRLLVVDEAGRVYLVARGTGKLLWSRPGPPPLTAPAQEYQNSATPPSRALPVVAQERLLMPVGGGVECWSLAEGKLLWRAAASSSPASALLYPAVFSSGESVLVCQPEQASLSALDIATGKLRWEREYRRAAQASLWHAGNCGASFSEGRLFLHGAANVIVSAQTGEVLWSIDPTPVVKYPLSLAEAAPAASGGSAPFSGPASAHLAALHSGGRIFSTGRGGSYSSLLPLAYAERERQGYRYGLQPGQQFALVHGAAGWVARKGEQNRGAFSTGTLLGERLLLGDPQGLLTLRLDLPFAAKSGANYPLAAVTPRFAAVLSGGSVGVMDLDSGQLRMLGLEIPLPSPGASEEESEGEEEPGQPAGDPGTLRVALDGPALYVSQRSGLSLFLLRTGQRLWQAPWPANVASPPTPAVPVAAPAALPTRRSLARYGLPSEPPLPTVAARTLVRAGVLYTEVAPGRLVALVGEPATP